LATALSIFSHLQPIASDLEPRLLVFRAGSIFGLQAAVLSLLTISICVVLAHSSPLLAAARNALGMIAQRGLLVLERFSEALTAVGTGYLSVGYDPVLVQATVTLPAVKSERRSVLLWMPGHKALNLAVAEIS
jgi:hypothetical protein